MTKVIILGTGAQAKHVINIFSLREGFQVEGLIEITPGKRKEELTSLMGKPVFGGLEVLERYSVDEISLVIAASRADLKEQIAQPLLEKGFSFVNCIHPSAVIAKSAQLGMGLLINPYVVIQPLAKIGNFVVVHAGTIIEHDNIIEDYVNFAPGVKLTGWVHVKKGATVYTGACVFPCKIIGKNSTVGAGCVVIDDVPDDSVVCGVPAKILRQ